MDRERFQNYFNDHQSHYIPQINDHQSHYPQIANFSISCATEVYFLNDSRRQIAWWTRDHYNAQANGV
jgi:hypothetical protein